MYKNCIMMQIGGKLTCPSETFELNRKNARNSNVSRRNYRSELATWYGCHLCAKHRILVAAMLALLTRVNNTMVLPFELIASQITDADKNLTQANKRYAGNVPILNLHTRSCVHMHDPVTWNIYSCMYCIICMHINIWLYFSRRWRIYKVIYNKLNDDFVIVPIILLVS